MNSTPDTAIKRLHKASAQRAKEVAGGEILRTHGMENDDINAEKLKTMPDLYSEGYIYDGGF